MAQIIRHRRGSLESLSAATSSFQKGELIIVSGSSNLTSTNGGGMVFAATESGSVQAVNRFLIGTNAPNVFSSSVYNGLVKGVPYYASGSSTLYLLGSDKNDIPDLTGNISNFSASVVTSFSASNASITSLSASVASVTGDFSSSVATSFSASAASQTALSASVASVTGDFSASVAQTFTTQSQRISSLESFTGSYATTGSNVFVGNQTITGSINVKDSATTFSIVGNGFSETYLQSNGGMLLQAGGPGVQIKSNNLAVDGSLTVGTSISSSTITGLGNATAFSTSVDSRFSASVASITSLSASVASVTGDFSSSVATSFSQSNASITSLSASVASVTGDFSSSVATSFSASAYSVSSSNAAQDVRINQLASFSGSYATTGSNVFYGTQVITGSLYVAYDVIVQGSSSLQYITASQVDLGANTIVLNNDSPAVRFGGISVVDSGSSAGASGSLFWDSLNNNWIYQHPSGGAESGQTAILISGPRNSGSMGSEEHITPGKIMVAVGDDHIGDSIVSQASDNSKITISGSLGVSGSIVVNNAIVGTGSIYLQPDIADARQVQIYNTGASDVHIKGTTGLTFLGDDTNYVKIDDNAQTVTVRGANGVFIETSLNVTGPISSSAGFSGSIEGIGNVSAYSSSVSASIAAVVANVGTGVGVSITNLNSFTSSALDRFTNIDGFTGSAETRFTEIGVVSGSLFASASTAKTTNDTQDGRLTNLENTSASVNISVSNLNTFSASVNTSVSALNSSSASQQTSIDALNTLSGSNLGRLSNLETTSASVNTSVTALNSSSASQQISIDALNTVSGSNLGRLSNLETTSASVNISITNINLFTSSVDTKMTEIGVVSGSLISSASAASISIAALNSYTSSNTSTTALNSFTASAIDKFTEIGVVSGSLFASASTAKTTNDTQDGRLSNLETTSGSVNISIAALNTSSASQQISIDALNTVSGSNLGRLTNLESTSASVNISLSNLNTTTASLNTSVAALNSYSSSLKTAFEFTGSNVVVLGDFTVRGTTTSVASTTVQLGDNIIELNGTGAANGGLLVKDPTAPNTVSGSLLWDSTNDYWKAGAAGAESKVALMGGDNLVTSSAQILLTQVDGYDTFSGSIATSISASVAGATWENLVGKPTGIVSGSSQIDITSTTGFDTFSGSIATSFATIDGGTY